MIDLQSLGGAGFSLRSDGYRMIIDPYFGGSPKKGFTRREEPPVAAEDVADSNMLLSTHSHGDHCDVKLIAFLAARTDCRFLGPRSSIDKMTAAGIDGARATLVSPGDRLNIPDGEIRVYKGNDPKEELSVIYVIILAGKRILHNGDSRYGNMYAVIGEDFPIDLALLNYGKMLYMSAEDVLQAATDLSCKTVVPMHWDLYEEYYLSPENLVQTAKDHPFTVTIVRPGEHLQIA